MRNGKLLKILIYAMACRERKGDLGPNVHIATQEQMQLMMKMFSKRVADVDRGFECSDNYSSNRNRNCGGRQQQLARWRLQKSQHQSQGNRHRRVVARHQRSPWSSRNHQEERKLAWRKWYMFDRAHTRSWGMRPCFRRTAEGKSQDWQSTVFTLHARR